MRDNHIAAALRAASQDIFNAASQREAEAETLPTPQLRISQHLGVRIDRHIAMAFRTLAAAVEQEARNDR
jgi:hypothetical protein